MPRVVRVEWPGGAPFRDRDEPIRILAVSDQLEPTLVERRNREKLGRIDLVVGCGDLSANDLGFIADGVDAPLLFVRGNHDGDERWQIECEAIPNPLVTAREFGIPIVGLSWPGQRGRGSQRSESGAWRQALGIAARRVGRHDPVIVVSHAPPRGAGDIATDAYHRGFDAYRWLLDRLRPPLWLHGHTPLAAVADFQCCHGPTTLVNVTGAVVVELAPPARRP